MTPELGLHALLSHGLLSLTRQYERTDTAAPTLPFYANLLRILETVDDDYRDVARRASISKRAAKTLLNEASKLADLDERRAAGASALAATEVGWKPTAKLRKPLEALVTQFDLEHPWYLMQYGTADSSAIGGKWPGHGQDWKPVEREGRLGVLPLCALLSAGLMDFTIRYESGRTLGLSWTTHALRGFPDEGVAFGDASPRMHLSGDGRSTLERHRFVIVKSGWVTLTDVGRFCRDALPSNVARVESEWREKFGDKTVTALRSALTEVDSDLEPGLADFPILAWYPFREASAEYSFA